MIYWREMREWKKVLWKDEGNVASGVMGIIYITFVNLMSGNIL